MIKNYLENVKFFIFDNQPKGNLIFFLIFLVCICSFLELIGVGIIALFVVLILNPDQTAIFEIQNKLNLNFIDELFFFVFVIFFFLSKNIFISLVEFVKSNILSDSFLNFQKKNIQCFLDLNYSYYKRLRASSFSKNVNFSAERTFVGLGESFFSIINEILIFISILALLSFTMTIYIMLGGLAVGLIYISIFSQIKSISSKLGNEYSSNASKIFAKTDGLFNGFKEIIIYNKKNYFISYFNNSVQSFAKAWRLARFILNTLKYINETLIIILIIGSILMLKFFDIEIDNFNFSIATLAVAIIRLYPNLSKIQNTLTSITITMPICTELKSFYLNSLSNKNISDKFNGNNIKSEVRSSTLIELKNVGFKYQNLKIIDDINISFKQNNKYFVYGPSGSGKTTLLEIICGLLEPTKGQININSLDKNNLISYVPQETYLIDTDIFNNVSLFEEKNKKNISKVEYALKEVGLFNTLNFDRDGLNTVIGENGVKLSSGQKQRLALARAIYQNRDVIILDEPTSNLDKKTEDIFMNNLLQNSNGKIIILVSHNLNFFEYFDYTYLLKNGKLNGIETDNLTKLKEML